MMPLFRNPFLVCSIGLVMAFSAPTARAVLGETEAQLIERHGPPLRSETPEPGLKRLHFQATKGWMVIATLMDGTCQKIIYRGLHQEAKKSRDLLLGANAPELEWVPAPDRPPVTGMEVLKRSDDGAFAEVPVFGGTYRFYTRAWEERKNPAPEAP